MFEQPPTGPPAASPQWARDPLGRHEYRYFDGSAWTATVSDAGGIGTDEPTVQTAQPEPIQAAPEKGAGASPLLIAGAVAMIVGPFLTWVELVPELPTRSTTISGVKGDRRIWMLGTFGDGWIIVLLGALLIVLLAKGGFRRRLSAGLQLAVGGAAIAWCAASWFSVNDAWDDFSGFDTGMFGEAGDVWTLRPSIGFWCALVGGVVVVASGLVTWRANRQASANVRSGLDASRLPGRIEPGSSV